MLAEVTHARECKVVPASWRGMSRSCQRTKPLGERVVRCCKVALQMNPLNGKFFRNRSLNGNYLSDSLAYQILTTKWPLATIA